MLFAPVLPSHGHTIQYIQYNTIEYNAMHCRFPKLSRNEAEKMQYSLLRSYQELLCRRKNVQLAVVIVKEEQHHLQIVIRGSHDNSPTLIMKTQHLG